MNKTNLRKYARLIVRTGANVQEGQMVVISSHVNDAYFTKLIVEEAYKAKASEVLVDWHCDEISKLTYQYASVEVLKELPNWVVERLKYRAEKLPAMIHLESSDPDAMASIDQNKLMEVRRAQGPIIKPIRKQMENKYQWTIAAIPGEAWAKKIFPNLNKKQAMAKLWEAILKCARVVGDPVENWKQHNAYLLEKCTKLNELNIDKLTYKSSNGTDFTVGLIPGVIFMGGGSNTVNGVYYNPNMPTEECFISPNRHTAEGIVYSTKPLSVMGTLVDNFAFRFEGGKVVEVLAQDEKHKAILEQLVSIDEGARQLGEVALVPFNSPVNETGILFYNTLFDENACCHLAIGMGFEDTIKGFETMTAEEIKAFDLNDSIIHVDFMIGSSDLSIIATTRDGKEVQIFKDGTWAI